MEFSYEALDNTSSAYSRLKKRIATLQQEGEIDKNSAETYRVRFAQTLGNDLNSSMALTAVYDILKAPLNDATKLWLIEDFDTVLSLNLVSKSKENTTVDAQLEELINAKIHERTLAKQRKDYATADAIREELLAKGIVLKDSREGTTWSKI